MDSRRDNVAVAQETIFGGELPPIYPLQMFAQHEKWRENIEPECVQLRFREAVSSSTNIHSVTKMHIINLFIIIRMKTTTTTVPVDKRFGSRVPRQNR